MIDGDSRPLSMQVRHALACWWPPLAAWPCLAETQVSKTDMAQQEEAQCLFLLSFLKRKRGQVER